MANKVLMVFGYTHQFLGGCYYMLFLRAQARRRGWALSPPHLHQAGTNPQIRDALVRWEAGEGFPLVFYIFRRQLLFMMEYLLKSVVRWEVSGYNIVIILNFTPVSSFKVSNVFRDCAESKVL